MEIQKIYYESKEYPYLLRQISDPPSHIFCMGDVSILKKRCIAMVGTREPSNYGRNMVKSLLSNDLRSYDICIVSGLARGIDAEVHMRCLEVGIPTIAIVAGSLDDGFPIQNKRLFDEISANGLVIAEYPSGTTLEKYMFATRNRVMVGISEAAVIIEANIKSGSMVTAQLALDSNRDVYAIPRDIDKELSQGCNNLIRDGANMILNPRDFIRILENEQRRFYI